MAEQEFKHNTLIFDTPSPNGIYWLSPNIAVFPSHTNVGIIAIPDNSNSSKTDIPIAIFKPLSLNL
mgnify:CR=1 FL=1